MKFNKYIPVLCLGLAFGKAQATIAFGWSDECDQQFRQARVDFPNVKYTE